MTIELSAQDRMALWQLLEACPKKGYADQRSVDDAWDAFGLSDIAALDGRLHIYQPGPQPYTFTKAILDRVKRANEETVTVGRGIRALIDRLDSSAASNGAEKPAPQPEV